MNKGFHEVLITPKDIPAIILLHNSLSSECALHWHSDIEICYSADSRLLVTNNDHNFILEEDSISVINSGELHQINAVPNYSKTSLSVIVSYQFLKETYPKIDDIIFKIDKTTEAYAELKKLLNKIYYLYKEESHDELIYLRINEALYGILYLLLNNFKEDKVKNASISTQKYHERYQKILKYIDENYNQSITLDDVASFSNISKHHLSREFKKYVGYGFRKHINKVRIQHSLDDLINTDMPLIDIAVNHGFNDTRSYISAFKEIFYTTPTKYRKQFNIEK